MDVQKIVRTVTLVIGTINVAATTRSLDAKTTPKEEGQESGVPDQDEKSKKGEEE